jgi:hypothetical protein
VPIRFTAEGQILFNAGQIVIRDDEDPSCCCGAPPHTVNCPACEDDNYFWPIVEISGMGGDCCAIYNGSYQTGHGGLSSYNWPCGGYAEDLDADTCENGYGCAGFLLMCYLTDENSDGVADTVHFFIIDTCAGTAKVVGAKAFTGNCRDLDVTLTAADLTAPDWLAELLGVCTKTGATVRIYVP